MSLKAGDVVRKKVLIVDDSVIVRHALCELFKREADFDVCGVAENGREAIEAAGRLNPDLIVLDLSMPVMNGLDAARILRAAHRSHNHVQHVRRQPFREASKTDRNF